MPLRCEHAHSSIPPVWPPSLVVSPVWSQRGSTASSCEHTMPDRARHTAARSCICRHGQRTTGTLGVPDLPGSSQTPCKFIQSPSLGRGGGRACRWPPTSVLFTSAEPKQPRPSREGGCLQGCDESLGRFFAPCATWSTGVRPCCITQAHSWVPQPYLPSDRFCRQHAVTN